MNGPTRTAPPRRPAVPGLASGRKRRTGKAALTVLGLLLPLALSQPASAVHYSQGEKLQFIGVVADQQGRPLPGVRVVLEASRAYFSFREFRRSEKDARRIAADSDAKGEYSIDWNWDPYFNHFKLIAGIPVRRGREDTFHILDEIDVTDRVGTGAPVVSTLEIRDRGFYDHLHSFMASLGSEDERRVYSDMGTPDDVKRIEYAGQSPSAEVTWWYFDAGKVYRFRDGRLEQVADFAPIHPAGPQGN